MGHRSSLHGCYLLIVRENHQNHHFPDFSQNPEVTADISRIVAIFPVIHLSNVIFPVIYPVFGPAIDPHFAVIYQKSIWFRGHYPAFNPHFAGIYLHVYSFCGILNWFDSTNLTILCCHTIPVIPYCYPFNSNPLLDPLSFVPFDHLVKQVLAMFQLEPLCFMGEVICWPWK